MEISYPNAPAPSLLTKIELSNNGYLESFEKSANNLSYQLLIFLQMIEHY